MSCNGFSNENISYPSLILLFIGVVLIQGVFQEIDELLQDCTRMFWMDSLAPQQKPHLLRFCHASDIIPAIHIYIYICKIMTASQSVKANNMYAINVLCGVD